MTNDKNVPQDATDEEYLEPKTTLFDNDLLTSDMIAEESETEDIHYVPYFDSNEVNYGLPTQVVHPWRTVARTAIQHVSGVIVTGVVWLFASIGIDISDLSSDLVISVSVVLSLLFTGLVARVMSSHRVEDFLVKWLTPIATGVSEESKSPAAKK